MQFLFRVLRQGKKKIKINQCSEIGMGMQNFFITGGLELAACQNGKIPKSGFKNGQAIKKGLKNWGAGLSQRENIGNS